MPVPFMYTQLTDRLYDEMQTAKPADLPPSDLPSAGKTYKLTQLFPLAVGKDLDLVVKYQSADVSNTAQTFQDNAAVMKGLRSEEHTSELQSLTNLVCRLLL